MNLFFAIICSSLNWGIDQNKWIQRKTKYKQKLFEMNSTLTTFQHFCGTFPTTSINNCGIVAEITSMKIINAYFACIFISLFFLLASWDRWIKPNLFSLQIPKTHNNFANWLLFAVTQFVIFCTKFTQRKRKNQCLLCALSTHRTRKHIESDNFFAWIRRFQEHFATLSTISPLRFLFELLEYGPCRWMFLCAASTETVSASNNNVMRTNNNKRK